MCRRKAKPSRGSAELCIKILETLLSCNGISIPHDLAGDNKCVVILYRYMENSPIIEVAKKVCPAVISIVITKDLPKVEGYYTMPMGGGQFLMPKFSRKLKESVKIGGGSGFFISAEGLVLTNSHVVADPRAHYTVILDHGKNEKDELEILARDPIHDIAVGRLKGKRDVAYLELGDSSTLQLGQTIVAVGYALGEFSNTVSAGIVSGLSRFITAESGAHRQAERLRGLIQTDAAINPGNSGGPLVDIEGKVVGINTAVVFGAQNIGFAIPINNAKKDIEEVHKYGRIRMPFLGVRYIILDEQIKTRNKLPVNYGALVMRETLGETAVIPGSSAEKAGLKEFDIILEADGKKITPDFTLQDVLEARKIGDEITLKPFGNGIEHNTKEKLEE